jgi:hypothetical protein
MLRYLGSKIFRGMKVPGNINEPSKGNTGITEGAEIASEEDALF